MSFWTEDLTILFANNQFINFVPKEHMSEVNKLNAMSRFCIYWMILLIMFSDDFFSYVYIPLLLLIVIVAIYYLRKNQLLPNTNVFVKTPDKQSLELFHNDSITDYTQFVKENKDKLCRLPTKENPYMNNLVGEDEPKGCKVYDPVIREQVLDLFNEDLYRDVGDLFDTKNSERQFMTMPYARDADTVGFANWLYRVPTAEKQMD
jgi:hypothetical protein